MVDGKRVVHAAAKTYEEQQKVEMEHCGVGP